MNNSYSLIQICFFIIFTVTVGLNGYRNFILKDRNGIQEQILSGTIKLQNVEENTFQNGKSFLTYEFRRKKNV